jgi:hypothetical protein
LVLIYLVKFVTGVASAGDFPEDKAVRVHVGHAERLKDGRVQSVVEHFRCHVAPSAHPGVLRLVYFIFVAGKKNKGVKYLVANNWSEDGSPDVLNRQTKVGDHAVAVSLDQNIFALDVSVGDSKFALGAKYFGMQVSDAAGRGPGKSKTRLRIDCIQLQVVMQRTVHVEVGDQQHLGPRPVALDIGRNEAWNTHCKVA